MSLSGDSCSTSSGCVSDVENLSEDPAPDSPISDASSKESRPASEDSGFGKELLSDHTLIDDVEHELDEVLEEIETEVVIDCAVNESETVTAVTSLHQMVVNSCCLQYDQPTDHKPAEPQHTAQEYCSPTFKASFGATASAKSDSGQTSSGHESHESDNGSVSFRPTINSVFKEVNYKCLKGSASDTTAASDSNFFCKWTNCDWPGTKDDLVDHIREIHVELQPYQQQKHNWADRNRTKTSGQQPPEQCSLSVKKQDSSQQYVCLWEGCKVYGKASLSRNWLERHVLEQHSGPRPFKCIVEGCGQRFKVQSALERHVNSHFKPTQDSSMCSNFSNCSTDTQLTTSCCDNLCPSGLSPFELHLRQTSRATISAVRSDGSVSGHHQLCANGTPNKILKRKKSTQKVRRKCFYVKSSEDFFDERVMEQVRYGLLQLSDRTGLDICGNASTITFQSKVIARRQTSKGEVNVLLQWEPNDILPDEWVPEDKLEELKSKTVPISAISSYSLAQLIEQNDGFERKPKTKQRRK